MAEVAGDGRRLRVDLDIDPSDEWDCPIVSETPDASDVAVNAVGHECTVDVRPTGDGGLVRARGEVSDDCLCRTFQRFGCVPHVRRVEDGTMLVTTYVDDRDTVREVVGEPEATEQVTFDLSALTPKQREGLELAVVRGYFDDDRDVELGELAAELEISKSALSQRLRAAQAKLVTDVFDEIEGAE